MAEQPRLEVQIGANIADIERALDLLDRSLADLQKNAGDTKGLDKLQDSFEQLGKDAQSVKTELIETGKTSKSIVGDFRSSAGDIAGALSQVGGAAGEAAEGVANVLSGFTAGGLAGAAVAVLGFIASEWDEIKVLTGDVAANLEKIRGVREGIQNVQQSELGLEKTRLAILQAEGASRGDILKQLEAVRAATVAAGNEQNRITNLIGEQVEAAKAAGESTAELQTDFFNSANAAGQLKLELVEIDKLIDSIVNAPAQADPTPFVKRVETITRGITASLGNIGAGVASQIQADPLTESVNKIGENLAVAFIDLQGIAQTGITNLATGIGLALAGGAQGIEDAGKLILSTLGGIISQIGQTFIASGTQKLIGEKLLSVFGGGAGLIAAGAALVAIGSALGSKASGPGGGGVGAGFRTGGTAGVATGGGIPQSSARTPSFTAGGPQTVIFEIAGTKLVGVLNNTLDRNQRLQNPLLRV